MPALGADMEAGTLVEWLIKPGDRVKRGDVVAVVETQKGAIEIETFNEGMVSELVVPVGTKVPVGSLIARIGEPAEVAEAYLYLMRGTYTSGQVLLVDGGGPML